MRLDQKQADALFATSITAGARRHQDQRRTGSANHSNLASGQTPAPLDRARLGQHIVQLVVALQFFQSHRQLQRAFSHLRQQVCLLAGIAQLLQQTGRVNLRLQERLQAQVATELGHDQHVVHAAATEAAMFLGNRHRTQAQFGHLVPERRAHAGFAVVVAFAGFEAVVIAGQSGHGIL